MKTLVTAILLFALAGVSAAFDLPDEPPDDFYINYRAETQAEVDEVAKSVINDKAFEFEAFASGNATLKVGGDKKVTFDIDAKSVKKLYNAVRKGNVLSLVDVPVRDRCEAEEIATSFRIVADGNENTLIRSSYDESEWDFIQRAIFEVLDENRPGWRGED